MAKYEYRLLQVTEFDRRGDWGRRQGKEPDRSWQVIDLSSREEVVFNDEIGDDREAFHARAGKAFAEFLNALGSQGWQIVSIDHLEPRMWANPLRWPAGFYTLMREAP